MKDVRGVAYHVSAPHIVCGAETVEQPDAREHARTNGELRGAGRGERRSRTLFGVTRVHVLTVACTFLLGVHRVRK